jgi:hypothetical protein
MRRLLIAVVTLGLAGCATTGNYEKILSSWVGSSADSLASSWGPPSETYPLESGGKLVTYMNVGGTTAYSTYNPYSGTVFTTAGTYWCKTTFTVDNANAIRSWSWQGNMCRAKDPGDIAAPDRAISSTATSAPVYPCSACVNANASLTMNQKFDKCHNVCLDDGKK